MNGYARSTNPPYWLIFGCEARRMEALTVELPGASGSPGGQRMLPAFGYGEEAKAFLDALRRDRFARGEPYATPVGSSGWRIRETTRGELVSLLCGPYADVHGILLDPPPGLDAEMLVGLVGVGRESFVERLLVRGRAWSHDRHDQTGAAKEADPSTPRRHGRPNPKTEADTKSPESGTTPEPKYRTEGSAMPGSPRY
jgi:hypothetical protein